MTLRHAAKSRSATGPPSSGTAAELTAALSGRQMDVTLAETGMMKLEMAPTNLGSLVSDVMELYEDVAAEKEITMEKQFDDGFQVVVDPARIRQVFLNLIDNAIKYMGEDRPAREIHIGAVTGQDEANFTFGIPASA